MWRTNIYTLAKQSSRAYVSGWPEKPMAPPPLNRPGGLVLADLPALQYVRSRAEDAADDLCSGAIVVHGRHEVRQPVAEVVHLPVEALDVAARLLEQLRRRRLAGAAAARVGEQRLELGDELVDLLVGDGAARRPSARHRLPS